MSVDYDAELLRSRDMDLTVVMPQGEQFDDDLMVQVVARQANEFICTTCLSVHHRSNLAAPDVGSPVGDMKVRICKNCA